MTKKVAQPRGWCSGNARLVQSRKRISVTTMLTVKRRKRVILAIAAEKAPDGIQRPSMTSAHSRGDRGAPTKSNDETKPEKATADATQKH